MDNYQFPKPGKTYISPSLPAFGGKDYKVRIASKVIESPDSYAFAKVKDEIVLRHREGAQTHIKAKFVEDSREIFLLNIQGYTIATEKPHNASFSFVGEEIGNLLEFIANIQSVAFKDSRAITITDEELRRIAISNRQAQSLVTDNEEVFAEVVKSSITKQDVVAVAYRKRQLDVFENLIEDDEYFDLVCSKKNLSPEKVWQQFFEKNPWIFGYGLNYIYLSTLDDRKLEQTVQGHSVGQPGKRVDALLKSRGIISSLCFLEIKTHRTQLVSSRAYRPGCWAPYSELSNAVAQVQGTVAAAAEQIRGKLALTDPDGFPTGEEAFNYAPKSYLVIGNLSEFIGENGINQEQYRSFELYRSNTMSPEILTFDELYERAKFIVQVSGG